MGFEARDVVAIIIMTFVGLLILIQGWRRWTGRDKEWANPAAPDIMAALLFGLSPLAMIALSVTVLTAVVLYVGLIIRIDFMLYAVWPIITFSFVSFVVVRFLRPRWSDPPWLRDYDWDEHNRRKRGDHPK
jgi:hypothetical protein